MNKQLMKFLWNSLAIVYIQIASSLHCMSTNYIECTNVHIQLCAFCITISHNYACTLYVDVCLLPDQVVQ